MPRFLVEPGERVEDCEAGARSSFGVIVMGLRIAEERHHAIAQIFRDVPVETRNRLRRRAQVSRYRLPPFLGIELRRDSGRAHEVAEQHGEMPPFARQPGVSRFRLRLDWRRVVERGRALRAESGPGWIVE